MTKRTTVQDCKSDTKQFFMTPEEEQNMEKLMKGPIVIKDDDSVFRKLVLKGLAEMGFTTVESEKKIYPTVAITEMGKRFYRRQMVTQRNNRSRLWHFFHYLRTTLPE